jgi:hypothetical protein
VLSLLEYWGMGYADAMAIPYSRRQRLLREKIEMEQRRLAQREASTARARRRR